MSTKVLQGLGAIESVSEEAQREHSGSTMQQPRANMSRAHGCLSQVGYPNREIKDRSSFTHDFPCFLVLHPFNKANIFPHC